MSIAKQSVLPHRISDEVRLVHELVKSGLWEDAERFLASFRELSTFRHFYSRVIFELRKQHFLELVYAQQLNMAVLQLVDKLKELEDIVSRQEFQELCYLVTVPCLQEHPRFQHWTPDVGRSVCWGNISMLVHGAFTGSTEVYDAGPWSAGASTGFQCIGSVCNGQVIRSVSWRSGDALACGGNTSLLYLAYVSDAVRGREQSITTTPMLERRHAGSIYCVSWCSDGELVASGSNDRSVCVQRIQNSLEEKTTIQRLASFSSTVRSCDFIRQSYLLACGCNDGELRLHDVATGVILQTVRAHTSQTECRAASTDQLILSSGGKSIKVWDVRTMRSVVQIEPEMVALCNAGLHQYFSVVGLDDSTCCLIDVRKKSAVRRWQCSANVRSVDISANAMMVLGNEDGNVAIANLDSDVLQAVGTCPSRVTCVRWQPGGCRMITAANMDGVTFLAHK